MYPFWVKQTTVARLFLSPTKKIQMALFLLPAHLGKYSKIQVGAHPPLFEPKPNSHFPRYPAFMGSAFTVAPAISRTHSTSSHRIGWLNLNGNKVTEPQPNSYFFFKASFVLPPQRFFKNLVLCYHQIGWQFSGCASVGVCLLVTSFFSVMLYKPMTFI